MVDTAEALVREKLLRSANIPPKPLIVWYSVVVSITTLSAADVSRVSFSIGTIANPVTNIAAAATAEKVLVNVFLNSILFHPFRLLSIKNGYLAILL